MELYAIKGMMQARGNENSLKCNEVYFQQGSLVINIRKDFLFLVINVTTKLFCSRRAS